MKKLSEVIGGTIGMMLFVGTVWFGWAVIFHDEGSRTGKIIEAVYTFKMWIMAGAAVFLIGGAIVGTIVSAFSNSQTESSHTQPEVDYDHPFNIDPEDFPTLPMYQDDNPNKSG